MNEPLNGALPEEIGVVASSSNTVSAKSFPLPPLRSDSVIVVQFEADQPGKVTFTAALSSPHGGITIRASDRDTLVMSGRVDNGKTRFEARLLVRAKGAGAKVKATDKSLEIADADAATLVLAGASSFVTFRDISGDPTARVRGGMLSEFNDRLMLQTQRHKAVFRHGAGRCTGLYDLLHDREERENLIDVPSGQNELESAFFELLKRLFRTACRNDLIPLFFDAEHHLKGSEYLRFVVHDEDLAFVAHLVVLRV